MTQPLRRTATMSGWGGTAASTATAVEPDSVEQIPAILKESATHRGVIARGLARSYGDAAQNAGGAVVTTDALDRILQFDAQSATIRVQPGVSLERLLQFLVPRGFFPTVIPGTASVTVGGAIASDIHGKFRHGSFCDYVETATLVTPSRGAIEISATQNPDAFWATAGGMGLTGIVTEATLRLHPIATALMRVDTTRCADVDACMEAMVDDSLGERYSVAWIDCTASGKSLGRSVLERGEHAPLDEIPANRQPDPLRYGHGMSVPGPPWAPSGLLNPLSVKAFNELWFRKTPRHPHRGYVSIPGFFHPLDLVRGWNRIYGKHGFVQYQFVVPYGQERVVRSILEQLAQHRCASFLAVLKRFETQNDGMLSFPMPGWTLALDIPVARSGLNTILDSFDEMVMQAGGRVYLAKDARVDPQRLRVMYPKLERWESIRGELDANRTMRSDLARRLGL